MEFSPLPKDVQEICRALRSPPRLVAHLTVVHDVARRLAQELRKAFPTLDFDEKSVLFGAATHDIGKAVYTEELVQPGHRHEQKGAELLRGRGVPDNLARFAYTHANWEETPGIQIEDLLVALADHCWKGKRSSELEEEVTQIISKQTQRESWEVFSALDDILQRLASNSDQRLSWQAQFPANGT